LPSSSTSATLIWTDEWSLEVIRRLVAAPEIFVSASYDRVWRRLHLRGT
jgi:hypothetical protein